MISSKRKPLITIKQQMVAKDEKNEQRQEVATPSKSMVKTIKLNNNELPTSNIPRKDGTKSLTKFKTTTENYYEKMYSKTPACKRGNCYLL